MEIKLNSWYNSLLRWVFYLSIDDLPKTLCTYFWYMVSLIILVIPIGIIRIPEIIILSIQAIKDKEKIDWYEMARDEDNPFLKTMVMNFFIWLMVGIIVGYIISWFVNPLKTLFGTIVIGSFVFLCSTPYLYSKYIRNKVKIKKRNRFNVSNTILVQYIKAKKHKYCLKIEYKK